MYELWSAVYESWTPLCDTWMPVAWTCCYETWMPIQDMLYLHCFAFSSACSRCTATVVGRCPVYIFPSHPISTALSPLTELGAELALFRSFVIFQPVSSWDSRGAIGCVLLLGLVCLLEAPTSLFRFHTLLCFVLAVCPGAFFFCFPCLTVRR